MNAHYIPWVVAFVVFSVSSSAQNEKLLLENLTESERKSIEAIALYPEEIRTAVLEVASRPAIMIKLKRIQEESRQSFEDLIAEYDRHTQEVIWDLTRFEGILQSLAASDMSKQSLEKLITNYPDEVGVKVMGLREPDFRLIRQVVHLQLQTESDARKIYEVENPVLQKAVQQLLDQPEVLSIICDELELAILVGNLYITNRNWLLKKADSLNLVLAAENSKALEDWKASIANDPEAQEELKASIKEYNEDYPFDDVYYDRDYVEDYDADIQIVERVSVYYHHHYPFWFGYPYWYDYPRWRPFPIWYDWGFYPYVRGPIIIFGLPRYHTVWWYFNRPYHHYRYSHLSSKFVDHYQTHREFGGSITSAVSQWKDQNREVISDEFLANRKQLASNLKMFGEMEENRIKYNQRNPEKSMTKTQYVEKYQRKYKAIEPKSTSRKIMEKEEVPTPVIKDMQRVPFPPKTEARTPEKQDQTRVIDQAKDYHRNKVIKKPETKSPEVRPAPPKVSPRKKAAEPAQKKQVQRKSS
ncbi:MAG: hypothetical protein IPL46_20695 [Saprospiraceae bacterium]|nr:hypothetical protein [Saprospiraceae bacterium]